jgi:transcriptional regulator with XRE-family HTH domain
LATLGLTDEQIADVLGIATATLSDYKNKHPEFSEALKAGKAISDQKVVESLYKRATGYSHPETKVFCNEGEITTVNVVRHHPPDTTACIFWLKNRDKENWRDKVESGFTDSEGKDLDIAGMVGGALSKVYGSD